MTDPELTNEAEVPTAVIRAVVPTAEITGFFDHSFAELARVLAEQGIARTGPAFARYFAPPDDTMDLEVGFPVGGAVSPTGQVRPGSLPAGRTARLVHSGGYDRLGESWEHLGAWIVGQGLTPGAEMWEVYLTEPDPDMDPAELRTELHWALR